MHFARVGYTSQGCGTLCKGGGKLYKGGVKFARVGYTFKECSRSEPYRFHSKLEAAG